MTLIDVLKIVQKPLPNDAELFQLFLSCGCTPMDVDASLFRQMKKSFAMLLQRHPGSGSSACD